MVALGITTSCAAIFFATMSVLESDSVEDGVEYQNITHIDFTNITSLADELSKSIGELLLPYLFLHGLELPMDLDKSLLAMPLHVLPS